MRVVIAQEEADCAAHIIQRAWRRYINKAPYKWCRAMLLHAENSNTAQMLLKFISTKAFAKEF